MKGLEAATGNQRYTFDYDVGIQRNNSTSYLYLDVTEEGSDSDSSSTSSSSTSTVVNASLQINHQNTLSVLTGQTLKSTDNYQCSTNDETGENSFTPLETDHESATCREIVTKQEVEDIRPQTWRRVDEEPAPTFYNVSESFSHKIYPVGEERTHLFDRWRRQALDFIIKRRNLFILEVFTVRECLLQVKMSGNETTISLNTIPWSIQTERSVTTEDVKKHAKKYNSQVETILKNHQTVKFSPSRLVRFILNNSEGVPAVLSSNYANIMKRRHSKNLIEHFVYRNILPGSQRCRHQGCKRIASAVKLDFTLEPTGIYCSTHALEFDFDDNVMLYNPLLVAFTAKEKNVVISAMDVEEVYGPRYGYWPVLPKGANPIPLAGTWAPLCKKKQFHQLSNKEKPIEMYYETARNVLDCASEHFRRGAHFFGVDVRHSITCCLLSWFLKCGDINSLCECSFNDTPSKEDVPYNWSKVR